MSSKFKCKESGCNKVIVFEPEPVDGVFEAAKNDDNDDDPIYLTCDNGHVNTYKISDRLSN